MTMADFSSIEIRIEAIEVEGLSQAEVPDFRRDLEREITRLIADGGLSSDVSGSHGLISATMPDSLRGDLRLAARVAAAIYGALTT